MESSSSRNSAKLRQQECRSKKTAEEKARIREINRLQKQEARSSSLIKTVITKFETELMNIQINYCSGCCERHPDIYLNSGLCFKCRSDKGDPLKFSARNGMDPGIQPDKLKGLTPIEEMLIAKCSPIIKVYKLKGGQMSYGGHIITFTQDVTQFVESLPRHPSQLGVLIVRRGFTDGHVDFKVRKYRILSALLWLKSNNKYYKDINIDMGTISLIPEDGDISHLIPNITSDETPSTESNDDYYESHVVKTLFASEKDMLVDSLKGLVIDNDMPLSWPRQSDSPIHEFTTIGYIPQCFPTLYPYGTSDFLEPRIRKIYPQEYFRHLFRYDDGRFAKHNTWRYFALNSVMRWSALTEGSVFYNKARNAIPPTIADVRQSLHGQLRKLAESMLYYGKSLRGSKQFWIQRQRELLAMVNNLGCPTYFFTFSAADFHWKPLHKLLHQDDDLSEVPINARRRAIIDNPGLTAWFIQKKMSLFLKAVISKLMPFKDCWYRYEWQHRGSGHVHGFLWLESAPNVDTLNLNDTESQQMLCDFHDQYTTTLNPACGLHPSPDHPCQKLFKDCEDSDLDYAELVNRVQLHTKCSKEYCLRINKATKHLQCRFGYPKDLVEKTVVELNESGPVIVTARNDPLLNSHNRNFLQAWRANMDIKPVICTNFVIRYVSKYCTKSEIRSTDLQELMLKLSVDLDPDSTPKVLAQKLLIHSVGERDYSAQETCHLLQSFPLYHSSRGFVTLNTCADLLSYKLKKRQAGITDGILEISGIIHTYKLRPDNDEFNNMSLLEFAKHYIKVKNEVRRRKPGKEAVVVIIPYIQRNEKDPSYCRQFIYLNKAFRDEEMMELESQDYVNIYNDYVMERPGLSSPSIAREEILEEDDEWELDENAHHNQTQWMALAGLQSDANIFEGVELGNRPVDNLCDWDEIRSNYPDWKNMTSFIQSQKQIDTDDLEIDVPMYEFSPEQKNVYDLVTNHYQTAHESPGTSEQLRLIVQGVAGTGKSYLIDRLRQFLNRNSIVIRRNVLEVLAYTGVAAFNVRGETLHSFFQIPINTTTFKELNGICERRLQDRLKDVKYIIIDEMSMIGCRMLGMVDRRLKQGYPTSQHLPFGGLNMILMGDHAQLPPLFDLPLYSSPAKNSAALTIDGAALYKAFNKVVILSQCYRQAGTTNEELMFRDILMRLRDGNNTEADWRFLIRRSKHYLRDCEIRVFDEALRLFTTNAECSEYNKKCLQELNQPIVKLESVNVGKEAYKADKDIAGGLERSLYLSKGSKVMLTSNLWKSKGLVNGALGVIKDIIFAPDTLPGDLPLCVLVEFKLYSGVGFITGSKIVPIPVLKHTWMDLTGGANSRSQIPLVLGFGITIHKSQGLTLPDLVLDIGKSEFATGLAYVGLSRVKGDGHLMFNAPFDFERLGSVRKSRRFQERILEEDRLRRIAFKD